MAVNDRQWQRLFVALGRPELATDPRFEKVMDRYRNIDECYGVVTEQMKTRTSAEWRRILDEADVPNGPVNDLKDLLSEPYLKESGFFQEIEHPTSGKLVTLGFGTEFSETKQSVRRPPPQLGEHTSEVLAELGLSAADIARVAGKS
jgi:crotonobetainyl-CoA:carnitine CoA-transferase CaiB-like acyl-CoA transferase